VKKFIRHKNPGWTELLITRMKSVAQKEIAVGYPRGSAAYPDGTLVAQVAYDNIEGNGCPSRDFMSYADPGIEKDTRPIIKEIVRQNNKGNTAAVTALQEAAGMAGAQAIKNAILEGVYEPNAPITIARKGSDKPLVDTSHMINSTTYVVRGKTR